VSDFFNSEMVRDTMDELEKMQEKLLMCVFEVPYYTKEEKKEYLQLMKDFLEKQKVLLFRMSLSDDPEAQITKEKILESAKLFGLKEGQGMDDFFEMLEHPIKMIEETLNL
jgi:peptidase E